MNEVIITFLASFLIVILFGALLVLWVVDGRVKREQALHALFSAVAAWAIASMIKNIFPTFRPFQVNGNVALTLTTSPDSAFPSVHSAVAFALAATVWLHDKRLGSTFLLGAVLVSVGRMLANVHYLLDIAGGAVLGVVIATIVDKLHLYNLVRIRRK